MRAVLCCAVLCCAVLCCAVLCCAVLCCAVLCCAVLCCAFNNYNDNETGHCASCQLNHATALCSHLSPPTWQVFLAWWRGCCATCAPCA
jgi:hypothetical protein